MIYSISRRTDMVAFYPEEIVGRVRRARKLEAMSIWTKDPRNILLNRELFVLVAKIPVIVQLTVTGLAGTAWEPGVPPPEVFLPHIREIARALPAGAVQWRFDPIVSTSDVRDRFIRCKAALEGALGELGGVTVSFADPYRHAVNRAREAGLSWPRIGRDEKIDILRFIAGRFAAPQGGKRVAVRLCCEPDLLGFPGVGMSKCVDGREFDRLYGTALGGLPKDPGQRLACGCAKSVDIGSYAMPCGHNCRYCYANRRNDKGA